MAQRSVWRKLREWGSDAAQRLLPSPNVGPDGHNRPGRFPAGPQSDLLQAAGAQRGNLRHDPPRPGLPGRHNLPPRFKCLRDQSLTGLQEPPTPSFSTFTPSITAAIDPSKTTSAILSACSYRGGPAPTYLAPAASYVSAAPDSQLQADTHLPPCPALEPELNLSFHSSSSSTANSETSLLNFPKPPDLFSAHSSNTPGQSHFTLPLTQEPKRRYLDENASLYYPIRVHPSCSLPQSHFHCSKHPISSLTSSSLPTVASAPTLLTHSYTNPSPISSRGSHLPHFPCSPYKHSSPSSILHPGRNTVLTHSPSSSSSLPPPPPPPPCPTGPGEAAAWGCCCSFGGAATPLTRYLGKVGQAALPLLTVGGLLNTEPSDVQTWDFKVTTPEDLTIQHQVFASEK